MSSLVVAGPNEEIFKFGLGHNITYKYETSDIMGMDAVFVHMAHYLLLPDPGKKSRATWMSEEKLDKMCERARKQAPLVIGAVSKDPHSFPTRPGRTGGTRTPFHSFIFVFPGLCGNAVIAAAAAPIHKDYVEKLKPNGIEGRSRWPRPLTHVIQRLEGLHP